VPLDIMPPPSGTLLFFTDAADNCQTTVGY
jgi:hypothetical protein